MAKKHFMIYYQKGSGTFVVTEPRPWARENLNLFEEFDFNNNQPTTNYIENFLIQNYGFELMLNDDNVRLIQNVNLNLTF